AGFLNLAQFGCCPVVTGQPHLPFQLSLFITILPAGGVADLARYTKTFSQLAREAGAPLDQGHAQIESTDGVTGAGVAIPAAHTPVLLGIPQLAKVGSGFCGVSVALPGTQR